MKSNEIKKTPTRGFCKWRKRSLAAQEGIVYAKLDQVEIDLERIIVSAL